MSQGSLGFEQILLCTSNPHKVHEITSRLGELDIEITLAETLGPPPDVEEDQPTLEGNAKKKAIEYYRVYKRPCLADDTGLMVDALDGAPGVHSARFAGADRDYSANNRKLISLLENVPPDERRARFITVMALALSDEEVILASGKVEGLILDTPRGVNGFGYDPIFLIPEIGKTMAEMTTGEKNSLSHRARALNEMKRILEFRQRE